MSLEIAWAIIAFLSTLSLRRATVRPTGRPAYHTGFLSTLSLRRATVIQKITILTIAISIHALLAESDETFRQAVSAELYFYPRSPCGERPL